MIIKNVSDTAGNKQLSIFIEEPSIKISFLVLDIITDIIVVFTTVS